MIYVSWLFRPIRDLFGINIQNISLFVKAHKTKGPRYNNPY